MTFVGEYKESFNEKELQKALNMLSVKQPLITAQIELNDNSDAFVETERVKPQIIFTKTDVNEFVNKRKTDGIDFSLLEFF